MKEKIFILKLLTVSVMLWSGCRVQHHTHSAAVANHATARTERDSIFVHDSIIVDYRRGRTLPATELLSSFSPAEIATLSKISSYADVVVCNRDAMTSSVSRSILSLGTDIVPDVYDADISNVYAVRRSLPCIRSPDTVYLERWHTAYRDRVVQTTDTVQVITTQTETTQVPYVPKFYKYCTALSALLLFIFLLQVLLHLRRRFH